MNKNRRWFMKALGAFGFILPGAGAVASVSPKEDEEDKYGFDVGDTVHVGSYLIVKDREEIHISLEEFKIYEVTIKKKITEKETVEIFDGCWGRSKKEGMSTTICPGGLVKKTVPETLERVNEHLDFMTKCYIDHEWLAGYKRIVKEIK